jgi:hypothetical protein
MLFLMGCVETERVNGQIYSTYAERMEFFKVRGLHVKYVHDSGSNHNC